MKKLSRKMKIFMLALVVLVNISNSITVFAMETQNDYEETADVLITGDNVVLEDLENIVENENENNGFEEKGTGQEPVTITQSGETYFAEPLGNDKYSISKIDGVTLGTINLESGQVIDEVNIEEMLSHPELNSSVINENNENPQTGDQSQLNNVIFLLMLFFSLFVLFLIKKKLTKF